MPRMDGIGPAGAGSMTGRGFGSCGSGEGATHKMSYGCGMENQRGMRCGRSVGVGCGRGWAFGSGFCPGNGNLRNSAEEMNDETRKLHLQKQRAFLKLRLDTIDRRLETL